MMRTSDVGDGAGDEELAVDVLHHVLQQLAHPIHLLANCVYTQICDTCRQTVTIGMPERQGRASSRHLAGLRVL